MVVSVATDCWVAKKKLEKISVWAYWPYQILIVIQSDATLAPFLKSKVYPSFNSVPEVKPYSIL
jgi:hypothetical protein